MDLDTTGTMCVFYEIGVLCTPIPCGPLSKKGDVATSLRQTSRWRATEDESPSRIYFEIVSLYRKCARRNGRQSEPGAAEGMGPRIQGYSVKNLPYLVRSQSRHVKAELLSVMLKIQSLKP